MAKRTGAVFSEDQGVGSSGRCFQLRLGRQSFLATGICTTGRMVTPTGDDQELGATKKKGTPLC